MSATDIFVGCDWGSTSFRLRIVERGSRRVIAEQSAGNGIKIFASLPAPARAAAMAGFFAERLAAWPDFSVAAPIIITGMASSNVGWLQLPYAVAPFPLDGSGCQTGRVTFPAVDGRTRTATLISGVRTDDDIMRGEECALIGANVLRSESAARGVSTLALLAGTHPKHALLHAGALISFRTHLTGELFEALAGSGLLAASIDRDAAGAAPDLESFRAGLGCVRERGISGALFQVRARDVLRSMSKPANTWFLSGVLVGAELERVTDRRDGSELLLIGEPRRVTLYREALRAMGVANGGTELPAVDLAEAVIAGQEVLLRQMEGRPRDLAESQNLLT
ncbi:MAG: hypothetical protein EXS37_02150 [Opitutus sp.]|nr:hypothetical protein [Opitutus sp.]